MRLMDDISPSGPSSIIIPNIIITIIAPIVVSVNGLIAKSLEPTL